jgi:hypothetical protein
VAATCGAASAAARTVGCGGLRRLAVKRVVEKAEVGFSDLRGRCLLGGDMGGGGLLLARRPVGGAL